MDMLRLIRLKLIRTQVLKISLLCLTCKKYIFFIKRLASSENHLLHVFNLLRWHFYIHWVNFTPLMNSFRIFKVRFIVQRSFGGELVNLLFYQNWSNFNLWFLLNIGLTSGECFRSGDILTLRHWKLIFVGQYQNIFYCL